MVEPIRTPPSASADEDRYRRHFLRADTQKALWVVGFAITIFSLSLVNDHRLFGWDHRFFEQLAARGVTVAALAATGALFLRARDPRRLDQACALLLAAGVIGFCYTVSTRPPDYIGYSVPSTFAASLVYLVLPGPLLTRAVGAVCLSLATVWFTRRSSTPSTGQSVVIAVHFCTHLVGVSVARSFERLRRESFFAQERAEALARAKSEFLATMSHEFRTPMNAVLGLSDILVGAPLAAEHREMAKIIHQSARSLLVLLNDILDLSKIEAGRMTVQKSPFDVRQVVESAVDLVRQDAAAKSLALAVAVAPDVPTGILGDAVRVRQVLVNLLSNAVKFTERGEIGVSANMRPAGGDERDIVLTIRDSGIGIAPELLAKLFTPFEQGGDARVQHVGGTGLGLAICRRLAALMGGDIRVESEVGRGSKFELSLRATAAAVPRFAAAEERGSAEPVPGIRILLAEDNPVNQRVARAMFDLLGCRPDIVENGQEALLAVSRETYDIVFMDLRMPVMDGIEAARRIQATLPPSRRPPIVAMTASAFEDDRTACLEAGMVDFVSKPVELDDLRAALQRRFRRDAATTPRQAPPREAVTLSPDQLDKLRSLAGPGDETFFAEVCATFRRDAPMRIDAAAIAAAEGSAKTAEREVHTLKSMAAALGAERLAQACASLERAANQGDLSAFPEGIAHLRGELDRLDKALSRAQE